MTQLRGGRGDGRGRFRHPQVHAGLALRGLPSSVSSLGDLDLRGLGCAQHRGDDRSVCVQEPEDKSEGQLMRHKTVNILEDSYSAVYISNSLPQHMHSSQKKNCRRNFAFYYTAKQSYFLERGVPPGNRLRKRRASAGMSA